MTNSENRRAKRSFDQIDDTNEAIAVGKLPDPASDKSELGVMVKDMTKLQIKINGMVDSDMSLHESEFNKKSEILNMAKKTGEKEKFEELESMGAAVWPSDRKKTVKKQSPLRQVTLA